MSKTRNLSKVLALVIMLALVIGVLPMGAMATNGYTSQTVNGLTFQFGDPSDPAYANTSPEQDMQMSVSGSTVTVTYAGSISNYFPDKLAFYVTSGAEYITAISGTNVTVKPTTIVNGEYIETSDLTVGFYVLDINTATSNSKSMVITKITNGITSTVTFNFDVPTNAGTSGNPIYAFLPAPGQFTNEGITTGGWGDAYVANGNQKNMVGNIAGTGVCLGYFGGYVVLNLGADIYDNPANAYGVDFIVYGNAFINNAEPGCIQVAQAVDGIPGDANNDGVIWYDIAGSLYYDADTAVNASFTYTNPHPTDDSSTTLPTSGTASSTASANDVPYVCSPNDALGNTSGNVTYNTFHRHAWFPLWANYFYSGTRAPLDKESVLPFVHYVKDITNGSELTLTGVMLGDATTTSSTTTVNGITKANYSFGYCDVHPKNSTAGYYAKAYNPYAVTVSDLTNSSWNAFLTDAASDSGNAGGGDPIDLAWAVYPAKYDCNYVNANNQTVVVKGTAHPNAGQPFCFDEDHPIRFIRIYTGAAKMNGILGEISTEVCGVYVASGSGTGNTTSATGASMSITHLVGNTPENPIIPTLSTTASGIQSYSVEAEETVEITFSSTGNYIFINEASGTGVATFELSLEEEEEQIIRVIVKDSSTGLPYIGYLKLVGTN